MRPFFLDEHQERMNCGPYIGTLADLSNSTVLVDFSGGFIPIVKTIPGYAVNVANPEYVWSSANLDTIIQKFTEQHVGFVGFQPLTNLTATTIYETFTPSIDITTLRTSYRATETALRNEYCYYLGRYQFAIGAYIDQVVAGASANQTTTQKYLGLAQELNFKLKTMLAIYSRLITHLQTSVGSAAAEYTALNASIKQKQAALAGQSTTKLRTILDTQKEMILYTEEKNRQTRNQLFLYSVLNVTAGGLLLWLLK